MKSHAVLRWVVGIPAVLVISALVAFGFFYFAGLVLGPTSLNVWGDAEGLIVPTYLVFGVVAVMGFVILSDIMD